MENTLGTLKTSSMVQNNVLELQYNDPSDSASVWKLYRKSWREVVWKYPLQCSQPLNDFESDVHGAPLLTSELRWNRRVWYIGSMAVVEVFDAITRCAVCGWVLSITLQLSGSSFKYVFLNVRGPLCSIQKNQSLLKKHGVDKSRLFCQRRQ